MVLSYPEIFADHRFPAANSDLGRACGKYYGISAMSILDEGDSNILTSFRAKSN